MPHIRSHWIVQVPGNALNAVDPMAGKRLVVIDEVVRLPKCHRCARTYVINELRIAEEMLVMFESTIGISKAAALRQLPRQRREQTFLKRPGQYQLAEIIAVGDVA